MTLTITLTPELELRLKQEAARRGVSVDECMVKLLDQHLPPADTPERRAAAIAVLQSLSDEGDAEEQKETADYLLRALDEDRLSDRKLFPPELKGISW